LVGACPLCPPPLATGLITVSAYCLHRGYKQTEAMLLQARVEAGILHRIIIIFTDHGRLLTSYKSTFPSTSNLAPVTSNQRQLYYVTYDDKNRDCNNNYSS